MKNGVNFFNKMLEGIGNNLNIMMLGEIKSYDDATNTAQVIPLHVEPNDGSEYSPLVSVPIAFFSIGGYTIKVKPKIGDKLLIFFFDYDVDNLLIDGTTKTAKTNRTHSLQDAVVIPLSINFLNSSFNISDDLTIAKEGTGTYIKIKNDGGIVLNASYIECGEGATEQVQLYGGGASTVLRAK